MASSKCSITDCKRDSDILCGHCENNICTKHYMQHVKLANDELLPLADQLNTIVNSIQQFDPFHQASQKLEQWRETSHRYIDELCDEKKQQLKTELQQKMDKQMSELRELSQQVKELIDEGDASFKQIEKIKKDVEKCRKQCEQFEKSDYLHLNLKPIEIEARFIYDEVFTGGTLLSPEQQIKLNELYGRKDQKWMLIYKATRDGFNGADFHRCCDNQGPTMIIIQSKNGGYLFGGYTSVSWTSIGRYVTDSNGAFMFTLTNPHGIPPTKYSIQQTQYSIHDSRTYGPTFGGGHDLYVCDNSQINTVSYTNFPHSYIDTTNRRNETFTGSKHFQTSDIEVYRLNTN